MSAETYFIVSQIYLVGGFIGKEPIIKISMIILAFVHTLFSVMAQ